MNSKTEKNNQAKIIKSGPIERTSDSSDSVEVKSQDSEVGNICDENLITLQKIHAILLNCSNLSKKQKLEFCESERYFMKLYLKKLKERDK
ncbi:hypothetical protein ES703_63595 [subsurface metagenome]